MKKLIIISSFLFILGCSTPIKTNTQDRTTHNQEQRLEQIGAISSAVDATLDNNDVNAVTNVKKLNKDIQALAEQPTEEEKSAVLNSLKNEDDKQKYQQAIDSLIQEKRHIQEEIKKELLQLSEANVKLKEQNKDTKEELSKYNSPWYSIKHGITIIIKRIAWGLGIFGVVFIFLRIFSTSNPIAGAAFDIFSHFVAAIFRGMSSIFPKLLSHIGAVKSDIAEAKETVLNKLVDEISAIKSNGTIDELKDALAKRFDQADKAIITDIKNRLGWK